MACLKPAYTPDVTFFNPFEQIYICGGEQIDGSRRIVCDEARNVIRAEVRIAGVWVMSNWEAQIGTVVIDPVLGELVLDQDGLLVYDGDPP